MFLSRDTPAKHSFCIFSAPASVSAQSQLQDRRDQLQQDLSAKELAAMIGEITLAVQQECIEEETETTEAVDWLQPETQSLREQRARHCRHAYLAFRWGEDLPAHHAVGVGIHEVALCARGGQRSGCEQCQRRDHARRTSAGHSRQSRERSMFGRDDM